jgi:selenocysteine lyase/cysteine desulfurase
MIDPIHAKDLFELEDGITYINCANMSPMLHSVRKAGEAGLDKRSKPWNITSMDWFTDGEIARALAARLFQANTGDVAIIPSASYGLAIAAKNIKLAAGKEIIVLEHQFPSNYYVWENMAEKDGLKMVTVYKSEHKTLTENILDKINANTGLVTIPNCHWIDGTWIDLQRISDAVKAVGAYFVLDLSQSFGVMPIDIKKIHPDFAVSVGYKWLLGPYSLGYMYVSEKWQAQGEPLEYSWLIKKGSEDFTKLTSFAPGYRDGARRFDMGEYSQFNILPMSIAALEQINQWGIANIQSEIKKLTDLIHAFKEQKGLVTGKDRNAGHITSIPLANFNADVLKKRLAEEKLVVSFRGTSIRVSPHLSNTADDINKLLACFNDSIS